MKQKKIIAAMLAATMVLTSVPVFAATGTKTATLNHAKIRFNGGPVQNIQCYNIDGYNYVRARDITNNLNMWIFDYKNGEVGLIINPYESSQSTKAMEPITQKTAKVNLTKGELTYEDTPYKADCFLLNGRYYFKLADFKASSDKCLNASLDLVDIEAHAGIAQKPFLDVFAGIDVTWNNDTKVIDVKRTTTDLVKIFNDIRAEAGNPVPTKPTTNDNNTSSSASENNQNHGTGIDSQGRPVPEGFENYQPQPPLTSAPKEGEILANILIDESKGAYLDEALAYPNYKNYTKPYEYMGLVGECTWYAAARLAETEGAYTLYEKYWDSGVGDWVENTQKKNMSNVKATADPYAIQARSIATWDTHASFIEWVDYDSNGNPTTVYLTEANAYHQGDMRSGKFYPDFDGKVQIYSFEDFLNISGCGQFKGYIMAK